jgi:YVTN family beta-propeller protein
LGRSPEGILMPPDGLHAYVAVAGDNNIAVVDLKTLELTDRIPTGREPDGMAWVEERR